MSECKHSYKCQGTVSLYDEVCYEWVCEHCSMSFWWVKLSFDYMTTLGVNAEEAFVLSMQNYTQQEVIDKVLENRV